MRYLSLIFLIILSWGCNKLELEDENLPSLEGLTPDELETSLDIVEISADQEEYNFMYNNYDWKVVVDAHLSMREPAGEVVFKHRYADMEVRGSASAGYVMKPLGFVFDSILPNNRGAVLNPPEILDHHSLEYLHTFRLRNSGNDFGVTMIKDLAYTRLAVQMGLDLEVMYGEPVHAFVNGRYYGLLNRRTESGPYGIAGLLQVDPDEVSVIKIDTDNGNLEIEEGNGIYATQLRDAIYGGDELELYEMIDISNFIDYIIFQDYIGNSDWPHNNTRAHTVAGSPFRFILYDLDYAGFNAKNSKLPEMEYKEDDVSRIYQQLRKIPEFQERLEQRQKELYRKFSPEAFNRIVDEMALMLEDEIPYLIARYDVPDNMLKWKLNLEELKREFERTDHHIRQKYDL